jgi:hypothetical protein
MVRQRVQAGRQALYKLAYLWALRLKQWNHVLLSVYRCGSGPLGAVTAHAINLGAQTNAVNPITSALSRRIVQL